MSKHVDIAGLVVDGLLELSKVFRKARWELRKQIAEYTLCRFGQSGNEPRLVRVYLETACAYGIVAYRFCGKVDGNVIVEASAPTLDRLDCVEYGVEYAIDEDEEPDLDTLIDQILATSYFGDATKEEIRELCHAATGGQQGYYMLPKGTMPRPLFVAFTTNGYLPNVEYVVLHVNYERPTYAAWALYDAIQNANNE